METMWPIWSLGVGLAAGSSASRDIMGVCWACGLRRGHRYWAAGCAAEDLEAHEEEEAVVVVVVTATSKLGFVHHFAIC